MHTNLALQGLDLALERVERRHVLRALAGKPQLLAHGADVDLAARHARTKTAHTMARNKNNGIQTKHIGTQHTAEHLRARASVVGALQLVLKLNDLQQ